MRYTQEQAAILHIEEIAPGVYNTVLSAKTIASAASAGQLSRSCASLISSAARFPLPGSIRLWGSSA